jgi:hypothetical protein
MTDAALDPLSIDLIGTFSSGGPARELRIIR